MEMKKTFYFAVVITLLLSGCSSSTEVSVPTSTNAIVPSEISTTTQPPTTTKAPTQTPTIIMPISSTPISVTTAPPTGISSILTAQASWNVCDGAEEPLYKKDLSPNGEWLAVVCDPNDSLKFNGTKIVSLDGNIIWDVSFYDAYGVFQKNEFDPDGIRRGTMSIVHWTNDGNYVYLRPIFCCVDAPEYVFFNYFNNALALYRLDLRSGKITPTLQPFNDNILAGYYVSFSPTDKYLAYVSSDSPRDVHLYNLKTGDVFSIVIDEQYVASGNFSWSQDSNQAVFVGVKAGWSYYDASVENGVSYFLLDLRTQSSIHLFDKQDLHRVSWMQDGNIILHNPSGGDGFLYNPQNNSFTVVTSTPFP